MKEEKTRAVGDVDDWHKISKKNNFKEFGNG